MTDTERLDYIIKRLCAEEDGDDMFGEANIWIRIYFPDRGDRPDGIPDSAWARIVFREWLDKQMEVRP